MTTRFQAFVRAVQNAWAGPGGHAGPAEVRAEIWHLGERHRGAPLEGALSELKASGLSASKTALLRACVRKLRAR